MSEQHLRRIATDLGARFFGIADLRRYAIDSCACIHGDATLGRAIVLGVALRRSLIEQLDRHREPEVAQAYRRHWAEVNEQLDRIALRLTQLLAAEGYACRSIPASQSCGPHGLQGAFSHKLAAHLAGLGWIGKSCLLITPELGPRVRWVTVLTDAPLQSTGEPLPEACGECRLCVEACPAHAFTGRPFRMGEPRAARFDALRCRIYHRSLATRDHQPLCGLCVRVCPHGR